MCGIAGFIGLGSLRVADVPKTCNAMGDAIFSRGPDDFGHWFDSTSDVALIHRRLAVVDLSSSGHQPMVSFSGRYVLIFNGEIYNHLELRSDIESIQASTSWKGSSDTETLLTGFEIWGVEETILKSTGMFAFALWDAEERVLTLGRDRVGEKPLYYGSQNDVFLFGSDLSALKAHPNFIAEIDRNALTLLLRYSYIPAPFSIYNGIHKLEAGRFLRFSLVDRSVKISTYWSVLAAASAGKKARFEGTAEDSVEHLQKLVEDSISKQMIADVPLGAFLSGGVDSSTVVAVMQSLSSRPVKTFSIGFEAQGYDEAAHAKAVAGFLKTDHTELYVSDSTAMQVVPILPKLYSEPFADSSQIPTYLVSKLSREHVTVSLSGDGGDELFCGYNRYVFTKGLWGGISRAPLFARRVAAKGMGSISPGAWSAIARYLPASPQFTNVGDKIHKGLRVLECKTVDEVYHSLISHHPRPADLVIGGSELTSLFSVDSGGLKSFDDIERMMVLDTLFYLPDDILVKVDRAAMGVSLETRVPFLDHRLIEFAFSLPLSIKLKDGRSKWPLRQLLYRYVPPELIERPKMGFGVPLDSWLRGPLREWAETLLNEGRLRREGYFKPESIIKLWNEHLSCKRNWAYLLWNILMFQAWLEVNR